MPRARLRCACGGYLFVVPGSASRAGDKFIIRKRACLKCGKGYETEEAIRRPFTLNAAERRKVEDLAIVP